MTKFPSLILTRLNKLPLELRDDEKLSENFVKGKINIAKFANLSMAIRDVKERKAENASTLVYFTSTFSDRDASLKENLVKTKKKNCRFLFKRFLIFSDNEK